MTHATPRCAAPRPDMAQIDTAQSNVAQPDPSDAAADWAAVALFRDWPEALDPVDRALGAAETDEATRLASLRMGAAIIGVLGVMCWAGITALLLWWLA